VATLITLLKRVTLALACAASLASAYAASVVVDGSSDPDSRLELRRVQLPDGSEAELYVLEGDPIVVVIDDDQRLEGRRIEFDPTAREVRVIGPGSIEQGGERFEGSDLVIGLADERLSGRDVLIVTGEIDVWGELATRLPGQVDVLRGRFSPCSRCDQEPWDYGFLAERLWLFPGDRLVAQGVTVLVRGVAVTGLPWLVLPLADEDRQPRLSIVSGNANRRAEVALTWPYVAGRDGLGRFTVRYLAEVRPGAGGWLAERLLGGAVVASHVAWELEHRLFDERGSGALDIAYLPSLPELGGDGEAPAELGVRLRYATDPTVGAPTVRLGLDRDDARAPGRWEYDLGVMGEAPNLRGRFDTRSFVDTRPGNAALAPSYDGVGEPRRTITRLRLEALDTVGVDLGPIRWVSGEVDLGVFEDTSDPTNRSAAVRSFSVAGRARVAHTLELTPLRPWAGLQIDGRNVFDGRYYDTAERLVLWSTAIGVRQAFGNAGELAVTFDRDVNEGETPFRFDAVTRRNRAAFGVRLRLAPFPSWSLDSRTGYVLLDTRRPEDRGWELLDTSLRLFTNVSGVAFDLRHRYGLDPDDDIHTVDATLDLRGRRAPAELALNVTHRQDLAPPTVENGTPTTETRTSVRWSVAVERVVGLRVETAHRPQPPPVGDVPGSAWSPLDVRLDVGSLAARDTRPGVRADLRVDLDEGVAERLGLTVRALFGEAELEATQRIALPSAVVSEQRVSVTLPGRFGVVLRGVTWFPPALLGLEEDRDAPRQVSLGVREVPESGPVRWEANVRTTFDPALDGGAGGRRDTVADLRVDLTRERLGPLDVSLSTFAEWRLRDDALARTHLRRASLTLGIEAFERVGVQGRLGYLATYAPATETFTRSELQLERVTLSVRATDQLTLGAQVSDVWDFTRTRADQSPWNVRPELFLVWDRCCWAFAAAYDTGSGNLRLVLTGPGAATGIEEILPTPFGVERRRLATEGNP
jgi:hypothetical protein